MKLKIENQNKLFFISDTHFGHTNVLTHNNRPFQNIQEHDESLIKNWNDIVPYDGIVIHQGDFSLKLRSQKLKWILESLNGIIYLCKGNHEQDIMKKFWAKEYFEDIQLRYDIDVLYNNKIVTIIADHFPLLSWNKKHFGTFHTFGHTHGNLIHPSSQAYDVGVDTNNYSPISFIDLMKKFDKK